MPTCGACQGTLPASAWPRHEGHTHRPRFTGRCEPRIAGRCPCRGAPAICYPSEAFRHMALIGGIAAPGGVVVRRRHGLLRRPPPPVAQRGVAVPRGAGGALRRQRARHQRSGTWPAAGAPAGDGAPPGRRAGVGRGRPHGVARRSTSFPPGGDAAAAASSSAIALVEPLTRLIGREADVVALRTGLRDDHSALADADRSRWRRQDASGHRGCRRAARRLSGWRHLHRSVAACRSCSS